MLHLHVFPRGNSVAGTHILTASRLRAGTPGLPGIDDEKAW